MKDYSFWLIFHWCQTRRTCFKERNDDLTHPTYCRLFLDQFFNSLVYAFCNIDFEKKNYFMKKKIKKSFIFVIQYNYWLSVYLINSLFYSDWPACSLFLRFPLTFYDQIVRVNAPTIILQISYFFSRVRCSITFERKKNFCSRTKNREEGFASEK